MFGRDGRRGKLIPPGRDVGRALREQRESLAELVKLADEVFEERIPNKDDLPTELAREVREMLIGLPRIEQLRCR
jgi:hypothetical protein